LQKRFDAQHRITEKLYALFPVGEKQTDVSIAKISNTLEERPNPFAVLIKTLDELECIKRETSFPGFQKQQVDWTLLVPLYVAKERLEKWHEKQRISPVPLLYPSGNRTVRQPSVGGGLSMEKAQEIRQRHAAGETGVALAKAFGVYQATVSKVVRNQIWKDEVPANLSAKVALATAPAAQGQETVAMVGPDRPSPFEALRPLRKDESRALIEAARQYRGKSVFLKTKITELRAEGFVADESMFSFERDAHLETIGLVLPYVESLEAENGRVATYVDQLRAKSRELEDLSQRYTALKRQNDRLVAERVGDSARVIPTGV